MSRRNEPCPCGSGRKYKRCCLRGGDLLVVNLDVQAHVLQLLDTHRQSVARKIDLAGQAAMLALQQDQAARLLRSSGATDTLQGQAELINRCHEVVGELVNLSLNASDHCSAYWFLLVRRLSPTILRAILPGVPSRSDDGNDAHGRMANVSEILSILTSLILGSDVAQKGQMAHFNSQGVDYTSLGVGELCIVGSMIGYALQIQQFRVSFRLINKGVSLRDQVDKDNPTPTGLAVVDYERRRRKYSTLMGFAGVWYDPLTLSTRHGWTEWVALRMSFPQGFGIQIEGDSGVLYTPWLVTGFMEERYLPRLSSLPNVPSHIVSGDDDNAMCGIPIKAILSTIPVEFFIRESREELTDFLFSIYLVLQEWLELTAVGCSVQSQADDYVQIVPRASLRSPHQFRAIWSDVAALGLVRRSKSEWLHDLWEALTQIWDAEQCTPRMSETRLREILMSFTRHPDRPVWSNEPYLFIAPVEHNVFLDLLRLGDALIDIFVEFNRLGRDPGLKLGDPMGPLFESNVASYFLRSLKVDPDTALVARVVTSGTRRREVDLAFVYRRCLIVIDCKAKPHDWEYMQGKHSRIRNHASEFKKEFVKNQERIQLIRDGAAAEIIPASAFDRAEAFVCTPTVEYLPPDEPAFWASSYARVGPPEELLDTIRHLTDDLGV
jgi:hypothetical protein